MTELLISERFYLKLLRHLFRGKEEQVVFLFCHQNIDGPNVNFEVISTYLVLEIEFEYHSAVSLELRDNVRPKVIKMAWDSNTCLFEVHSHRTSYIPAQFSASDIYGFSEFVPHVWWRLEQRPYGALVLTRSSFDALVWLKNPQKPEPLRELRIGSKRVRKPTNLTFLGKEREFKKI